MHIVRCDGEREEERASLAKLAFLEIYRAAHGGDDELGDVEPEAGALCDVARASAPPPAGTS